jgi:hypothetical protein
MASTIFNETEPRSQTSVCRASEGVLQKRCVMDTKRISMVSGAALLALTATASAGPMSVANPQVVTPPIPIEQAHYYYRHHYRHYGWYHHRYRHYGWRYHRYWNPGAAVAGAAVGLATVPFALATGGYYGYYPYYGYYGPYYYY